MIYKKTGNTIFDPEHGCWQNEFWGGRICDDESLICDKIGGCCFLVKKWKKKKKKWGSEKVDCRVIT